MAIRIAYTQFHLHISNSKLSVQVVMLFQKNTVQNKMEVGLKVYLGREGLVKYEGESVWKAVRLVVGMHLVCLGWWAQHVAGVEIQVGPESWVWQLNYKVMGLECHANLHMLDSPIFSLTIYFPVNTTGHHFHKLQEWSLVKIWRSCRYLYLDTGITAFLTSLTH